MRARVFYLILVILAGTAAGCSKDAPPTTPQGDLVNVAPEIVAWLRQNAIAFTTAEAGHGFGDLMPLKQIIGDVRIVALGEATHGTREFFLMKHRLLEFLVEEMGFTSFAIEATWPESNRVNDYIRTGQGDPAALLAGLYFWTWNTQEVLDMILWMRQNGVSFHGFDMQFPAMAMENVEAYVAEVDTANQGTYKTLLDGFRPFAHDPASYDAVSPTTQDFIKNQLQQVHDMMTARRLIYEERSSVEKFAYALQSARVLQQGEHLYSGRDDVTDVRDAYMAENVSWILDQEGPNAKIVLWAHNFHVGVDPVGARTMGSHLRQEYQDGMVIVGFNFFKGSFNAVDFDMWNGIGDLTSHTVGPPPEDSYAYHFRGANMPRMILDLRGVDFDSTATDWLPGPRRFRIVGALYDDSNPLNYFYDARLPVEYDVIVYFQNTTPSVLLPFPAAMEIVPAASIPLIDNTPEGVFR